MEDDSGHRRRDDSRQIGDAVLNAGPASGHAGPGQGLADGPVVGSESSMTQAGRHHQNHATGEIINETESAQTGSDKTKLAKNNTTAVKTRCFPDMIASTLKLPK